MKHKKTILENISGATYTTVFELLVMSNFGIKDMLTSILGLRLCVQLSPHLNAVSPVCNWSQRLLGGQHGSRSPSPTYVQNLLIWLVKVDRTVPVSQRFLLLFLALLWRMLNPQTTLYRTRRWFVLFSDVCLAAVFPVWCKGERMNPLLSSKDGSNM